MSKKCPYCGAKRIKRRSPTYLAYECGTVICPPEAKFISRWCVENQLANVTAERDKLQDRAAELEEVAKVALKSLDDCTLDIAQWVQLARYQREQSADPSHDPKCATERAIIVSEERVADAYCAADAIRRALAIAPTEAQW